LIEEGYKGAEKIKEAEINVAVARAKYGATVDVQNYRLTKQQEQFDGEVEQEKLLWDNKVIAAIAKKVAEVDAALARLQGNPEFAEQLRQWKEDEDKSYKEAEYGLKYGFHGLSHPALNPPSSSQVQISQSNQSQFVSAPISSGAGLAAKGRASIAAATMATGKPKDSINLAINWSGDMAGQIKGVASRINRGFTRFGNFFGGKG
jgi:predicted ATP-grasp superfamily ATP-dependent carboligase